ncbi:hypothetical protein D3Y57_07020 [Sphingomonas paeninsulae]|uniref:Uncharacterized protein n=1 Tax=Sphingomonas paeninsulae TaxID=2319844 RepID=A0A494T8U7_SPHPE|nr:hypothetical protein D3Y57_07020 [Sphingomonas paeninsulae]
MQNGGSSVERLTELARKRGLRLVWRSETSRTYRGVTEFVTMLAKDGRSVCEAWAYSTNDAVAKEAAAKSMLGARA